MSDLSSEVTHRLPCAVPIPRTLLSEQRGECMSAQIPGGARWGPPGRLANHGVLGRGILWSLVAYLSHWLLRSCPCSCVAPGPLWAPSFPPDLTPSLPFLRMHPYPRSLHISPTPSRSPGSPFQSPRWGCFAFTSFQSLCQRGTVLGRLLKFKSQEFNSLLISVLLRHSSPQAVNAA